MFKKIIFYKQTYLNLFAKGSTLVYRNLSLLETVELFDRDYLVIALESLENLEKITVANLEWLILALYQDFN